MRLGKALATGTAAETVTDETPVPVETYMDVRTEAPAAEQPAQSSAPVR